MPAHVLIIGVDPASLELLRYLLESSGHSVRATARLGDGMTLAPVEETDLVLCDMQTEGLEGAELLSRLREEPGLAGVAIVALAASAAGDGMLAGFDGRLSKPIDAAGFVAQIEPFLRNALIVRAPAADSQAYMCKPPFTDRFVPVM